MTTIIKLACAGLLSAAVIVLLGWFALWMLGPFGVVFAAIGCGAAVDIAINLLDSRKNGPSA